MSKTLPLKPRLSEKTYALSASENTFVFDVPMTANKQLVEKAVKAQFDVTPTSVRIAVIKGKVKRIYRRSGRALTGSRNDIKKAYVRLKEGDSIPVFAAIEEANKAAEKAEAKSKKKESK